MQMDAEVPFAALSRLTDVLDDTQGVLKFSLKGAMDEQGNPVLDVSMDGLCHLRCQRCLQGMDYTIRHDTRLMLRDEDELDELQDDDDEFDSILADPHLDVLELLEEEILLSLPIAPRHEPGVCQAAASESVQQEERHPFAVLEKLKRN